MKSLPGKSMPEKSMSGSFLDPFSISQQEHLANILSKYVDDMERGDAPRPEELLAAHPELDAPLRGYLASLNLLHQATGSHPRRPKEFSPTELPDGQLGDFRLVRELGRGGMGIVYEARQISLGRTVALKILPFAALLDQKQVARFQNEAQAAAALHHPNIVTVFGVGCERGVHYYSMQFIDGQSLCRVIRDLKRDVANQIQIASTHASQAESLATPGPDNSEDADCGTARSCKSFSTVRSVRTRNYVRTVTELAVQAADALHHAHQCGVVHRDIKPSNLLVDIQGKLWVTDFGLARCEVGPDLTATGDILGTLRYMSPEQAAGKSHLIDHRTDVYSLGITLYELLALRPAFDGDDRAEILRRIREEEPRSLRAGNPAVPYDLETIILKAMAKARDDRYASSQDFGDDLKRFLAGEPARARRPTLLDRSAKWLMRHKAIAATSLAILVVALAGASFAAITLAQKQAETDYALSQARFHLRELQKVVDRLGAGVSEQLVEVPGAESVRGNLLRETLTYYQAILKYAGENPALTEDAGKAAFKAGSVHEMIGENEQAVEMYRLARRRFSELVISRPGQAAHVADLAFCENNHGALLARLGKTADAEDVLRSAIERQQKLLEEHPQVARYCDELALSRINLGLVLADVGRTDAAAGSYGKAIELLKRNGVDPRADAATRLRLANAEHNLSGLLADSNPYEAERLARDAVSLLRELKGRKARADLALALANLGVLLNRKSQRGETVLILREAIELQSGLASEVPLCVSHRVDLATSHNNLGQAMLDGNDAARAAEEFEMSRGLLEQLVRDVPDDPVHFGTLAGVLNNLGIVRERQGKLDDAAIAFERAVALQQAACARAPQVERYRVFLDRHFVNLRRVLETLGRADEVEQIRRRTSQPHRI